MVIRRRTQSEGNNKHLRDTRMLDAEVVDTLFQLDSIVTELERETLTDLGPSPLPQSSPALGRKISPSDSPQNSIEQPSPSSELSSSLDSDLCRELTGTSGTKQFPSPPRSRALPCVSQLKQQFTSPQRPLSAPLHRDAKHENLMLVKGNVKNIIAQMQTTAHDGDQPRSVTPPFVSDPVKKRHSIAIQSKISEFTQQWNEQNDKKKERRKSQSYTPPAVRRRIQSPFLQEEFRFTQEITKSTTCKTKEESKFEAEIVSLTEKIEELSVEENEKMGSPTRTKKEFASEAEVSSPTRPRVEKGEGEVLSGRKIAEEETATEVPLPIRTEEQLHATTVTSPSRTGEQKLLELLSRMGDKSHKTENLPTGTKEISPMMDEPAQARIREKSPMMEELSTEEDLPLSRKERSPTPVSVQRCLEESKDFSNGKTEGEIHDERIRRTPERMGGLDGMQSTIVGQEEDVAMSRPSEQATLLASPPSSAEMEKSSEENHLVSFLVLSPPHKKSPKKKVKIEQPSAEEVAAPDNIELTLEENTSTSTLESDHKYEAPRKDSLLLESPHRVEVVIGMKENGIFTPPKIVEDDEKPRSKLSSQYDHLSARSQYDHLAPLEEPEEDPYMPFHRHRSASDISSHRIRPLTKGSLNDELMMSEVGENERV